MKKEDFVKIGVSEELAEKCEKAFQEDIKNYIPKSRFDEVNNSKKKLEEDVKERDKQLEDLKNSNNVDEMKKQIETLQAENKAKDEKHNAEIKQLKIDNAIEKALVGAKARNNTAVKALLKDLDKAEFDDSGTIKGLAEQIKNLQESDAYLFNTESKKTVIKGAKLGETGNEDGDRSVDTSKMTYSELAAYMAKNPDAEI